MRNFKLTVEYDGTSYCGWQTQVNGTSIQEVIEKSLKHTFKKKVALTGAGRTDSGVHSVGQVASFRANTRLTRKQLLFALNSRLPNDIAIKKVEDVGSGFNACRSAKRKLYRYAILNSPIPAPLLRRYSYRYTIPLNINAMRKASMVLKGRHDFKSFRAAGSRRRNSITTIYRISTKKEGDFIHMDMEAKGFLYNMVRNIAGTLIEIGRGKLQSGDMKRILQAKDRAQAGPTAPAKGLCLIKVSY